MKTIVLALYAEGPTDERFLPIIIQRTVEKILSARGRTVVEVLEPMSVKRAVDQEKFSNQAERILEAARQVAGYHALIVHADADAPTPDRAFAERIEPGLALIAQSEAPVCDHCLPIIPVQNIEAWLLADPETFGTVVGTNVAVHQLGLPSKPKQVESIPKPKEALNRVIQTALAEQPRRRRRLSVGSLYEPLARQISLERLGQVPAYQQFEQVMTKTLIDLHFAA